MNTESNNSLAFTNRDASIPTHSEDQVSNRADTKHTSVHALSKPLLLLFAITAGLSVANVYFAQPLLDSMSKSLGVPSSSIGIVVTITQLGYAIGLAFLVPLGDLINRRTLILSQLFISALALLSVAFSSSIPILLISMLIVGLMAVVVQILVAFTATLASPDKRGHYIGIVTSGIVTGILLARFVSGVFADLAGWRSVYLFSAVMMILMAVIFYKVMPRQTSATTRQSYFEILQSTVRLFISEKIIRVRATLALLIFTSFSILWTSLVLPLSIPPLLLSHTEIGLFGLAGLAGALAAAKSGKWADQGLGQRVTCLSLLLLTASWIPITFAQSSLFLLAIGVIALDFAIQAVHVTNQSLMFASKPDSQSRTVAAYMLFYSIGSGLGAIVSTNIYSYFDWIGVCFSGALVSGVAFIFWFKTRAQ
ncbi:MFS transporter [Azomonas macrocytogenes]|uniref:Putative MFS family arabinose efflux permease n=1 Tax=Azomonas macrocytogenes TaxID=69962 RepID=A0A839TAD6_AZOMA|nr:MFS transporter [Azomonas macrocytogenes]MBB3105416.1 putative MFS family arabinose efflux permease [Azomonas macrocytogenes]